MNSPIELFDIERFYLNLFWQVSRILDQQLE